MSWQAAWREGRTGWDAGKSPPILHRLAREGALPSGLTVVPGCGSGYDVFTLTREDRPVIGIDIAPGAGARFEALREERGISPALARIHIGDFFAFEAGEPVKLFWDYTFFCALEPERRRDWGAKVDSLLADDGELITLIFPTADRGNPSGPPYTVSLPLYREALGPRWEPTHVEDVEQTHPGREGCEVLARWKRA